MTLSHSAQSGRHALSADQHYARNVAQSGDALALLRSLSDSCTRLVFFDPQHRENLDHLAYGNEGARQRERCLLPSMSSDYIDDCCREAARALMPSGYLMLWQNAFGLVQGHHLRVADVLQCVDLIAWDNQRQSMGYRSRRRGDYAIIMQKPPVKAKVTWRDHAIPDRWAEKVDRKLHHIKPVGLTTCLIGAVTVPGELVVDPAAGSFVVMHAAHWLDRDFIGCDVTYDESKPYDRSIFPDACAWTPGKFLEAKSASNQLDRFSHSGDRKQTENKTPLPLFDFEATA
jgi:site-specific DNA-methyltransferase (adenine-specific)